MDRTYGDRLWELLREKPKPHTLASAEQVRSVAYTGEPIPARGAVLVGVTEFDSPQVRNLPFPLRDIQILEERFRALHMDNVTVLTSAQKDPARKPKAANIVAAINEMRARIGPQGLLTVVVSTHGFVQNGVLCLVPTDYAPATGANVLGCGELAELISGRRGERGSLIVDHSSHHVDTARSFPAADVDSPVPLPPSRVGFVFLCSPPRMPVSFCSKLAAILDELIDRRLPICANAIFAIFDKHAEKWFGPPKKQMVLMSDRASSGRAPLFDWALVSHLDSSAVSYVLTLSVPVPSVHNPIPDAPAMCRLLQQAVPTVHVKQLAVEDHARFIVKISGGPPTRGPREDKAHFAREVAAMCAEKGLPKVDVVKAWFGKLICVTAASSLEVVCRAFQSSRTLQSYQTAEAAPSIDYVGVLCRPEVQSPFSVHMHLDELCRRRPSLREPNTGIYIEELSQVEDGFYDDNASEYARRPHTPSGATTAAWAKGSAQHPPPSPTDDGRSPTLTKVDVEGGALPSVSVHASAPLPQQSAPAPAAQGYNDDRIARLEAELRGERSERLSMMERFEQRMRGLEQQQQQPPSAASAAGGGGASSEEVRALRAEVAHLRSDNESLHQRLDDDDRRSPSPGRGGAAIHITNDEWMVYQDQLKLLQVQLRDVQTHATHGHEHAEAQSLSEILPGRSPATAGAAAKRTPAEVPQGRQVADLSRSVQEAHQELTQQGHVIGRMQEAITALQQSAAETQQQQQQAQLGRISGAAAAPSPQRGGVPSVDDVRLLKQRIERIETHGGRSSPAPAGGAAAAQQPEAAGVLEHKVDVLQGVVDKIIASVRGLGEAGEVRKAYNDMMLDDIDAQLQGKLPAQGTGAVYIPAGLKAAIHGMVTTMLHSSREQIEHWSSTQAQQAGAATHEQIRQLQGKVAMLQHQIDSGLAATPQLASVGAADRSEAALAAMQSTLGAHAMRLQAAEAHLETCLAELHTGDKDVRAKVDVAIQRVGQTVLELDQKVMKDVTDQGARTTVADQRIKHLDTRLTEDAERMHRIEDRIDQSTRVLQERVDDLAQRLFDSERRVTTSMDDKVSVMRQISEVAEKGTLDLERRCADSEAQLKAQLRSALQQHIEGLEEVLQGMKSDLSSIDERTVFMESIVNDCKVANGLIDQKVQMTEKTVDALRTGFETYVHDGTVHIMQAQNEKLDELRTKLGHELDSFDTRIGGIENQRKQADEELATALEKIQIAVANQPSHDKVDRALAAMEEHRIRPMMEAATRCQGLVQRVDSLDGLLGDTNREVRERGMEVGMLRDQIAALRAMQDAAKPAPIIPTPAGLSADDAAKVASLERRVADAESKCGEIPALQRSVADVKGTAAKVPPLEDQVTAMRAQIASITGAPPPPPPVAAPTGGGADSAKVADLERRLAEQEETT
eukprot:Rhum_TRINITY_DN15261_c3_g2::Rhum_TRINITY_DN15261_c3_g2_i1::g.146706::m.146706